MTERAKYRTLAEIKAANAAAGSYFFERKTMEAFGSKVYPGVYGGRYFVTSERFTGSNGESEQRKFKIRRADAQGRIFTLDGTYATREDAREEAKRLGGLTLYRAKFMGRRVGAIGVSSSQAYTVAGEDREAARLALYDRWEHIHGLILTEVL